MCAILAAGKSVGYPARVWLYRQDEPARHFYLIESGLIRISQVCQSGEDITMSLRKPGDMCGFSALTEVEVHKVSAQTLRPARLTIWDREPLLRLVQSMPVAAMNLFNAVVDDALHSFDRTRRLLTDNVACRVAWAVSELARTTGVATPKGVLITEGIAQKEVAELAGTNIFTVSRELTKLERMGILEKQRGRILVSKPEDLAQR